VWKDHTLVVSGGFSWELAQRRLFSCHSGSYSKRLQGTLFQKRRGKTLKSVYLFKSSEGIKRMGKCLLLPISEKRFIEMA
jgi:hypothetical protein